MFLCVVEGSVILMYMFEEASRVFSVVAQNLFVIIIFYIWEKTHKKSFVRPS